MQTETPGQRRQRVLLRATEVLAEPPPKRWQHVVTNVTLEEASELCRQAWLAPYDESGATDRADIIGACVSKSLWLQERLGGFVASGFTTEDGAYHAVLVFACEGELFVADSGELTPIANYPLRYDGGFYHKEFQNE